MQDPTESTFGFGAIKLQDFFPADLTSDQALQHVIKLLNEKEISARVKFTEGGLCSLTVVYVPFSIPRSKDVTHNEINKALSTLGRFSATDKNPIQMLWQGSIDSDELTKKAHSSMGMTHRQ